MVDLGGYVIILVETHDKKVKLYGKQRCIYASKGNGSVPYLTAKIRRL